MASRLNVSRVDMAHVTNSLLGGKCAAPNGPIKDMRAIGSRRETAACSRRVTAAHSTVSLSLKA